MNLIRPFTGFLVNVYRRSPFWYWKRFIESDALRLYLGGKHFRGDFWFRLNQGWHNMQP